MSDEIHWLTPPETTKLTGDERFKGMDGVTVRDFWRFALGDLRMNNARGYLAEFLVGNALRIKNLWRIEWEAFDLKFGDITIEVKSSAYLQPWEQKRISSLTFSGLYGTRYHPRAPGLGLDPLGKRLNAMVYVFCAQTIDEHDRYDQLDISQWEFYVVPRSAIAATGYKTLSIRRVRQLAGRQTQWDDLGRAVTDAAVGQGRPDDDPSWWRDV